METTSVHYYHNTPSIEMIAYIWEYLQSNESDTLDLSSKLAKIINEKMPHSNPFCHFDEYINYEILKLRLIV